MTENNPQRRMLDKKKILERISQELEAMQQGKAAELMLDLNKLNEIINQQHSFPWHNVAEDLGMDRWRLYHWYFETFQRMLLGGVEKNDQAIIKQLIKEALLQNIQLTKQYQQFIKSKLQQDYHRSSFSIAFNNQKRQVIKELGKENHTKDLVNSGNVKNQQFQNYQEVKSFITQAQEQIKIRSASVSFANGEEAPDSPRISQLIQNTFVPVMNNQFKLVANKQQLDFFNEPSTTTADFLQKLNTKINDFSQQLEENKQIQQKEGDDFETQQINYLLEQLRKLEQQAQSDLM